MLSLSYFIKEEKQGKKNIIDLKIDREIWDSLENKETRVDTKFDCYINWETEGTIYRNKEIKSLYNKLITLVHLVKSQNWKEYSIEQRIEDYSQLIYDKDEEFLGNNEKLLQKLHNCEKKIVKVLNNEKKQSTKVKSWINYIEQNRDYEKGFTFLELQEWNSILEKMEIVNLLSPELIKEYKDIVKKLFQNFFGNFEEMFENIVNEINDKIEEIENEL